MNIVINDFNIYYEKHGEGKKKIIILPGWGDTRKTFKNIIENLKRNFTVYILDYPGFGASTFPNRDLTIYDYANLINDFINILGLDNFTIISHSFGSRLSIILATKYKLKIDKMIIIDGAGIKRKKTLKSIFRLYSYKFLKKLQILIPKSKRKKYLTKLINIYGSSDYKNLNDNMRKTFSNIVNEDLSKYLKNIKIETLLIWGELDNDTPLSDGIKMNKEIKDSGLIIIKKGSHFSYLEAPIYINNIINTFINH